MKISYNKLLKFTSNFLTQAGVNKHFSIVISKKLIKSDMSGHHSHGIIRLIQYFDGIKKK